MSEEQKTDEPKEEQYDLHMRFIGTDELYWEKLQERFAAAYSHFKIKFSLINPPREQFNPMKEFIALVTDKVDILFFEAIYEYPKNVEFVKFVRRDQRTKRVSTTVLHAYHATEEFIGKITFAGARINQIKSDEFSGVIFGAMALYDAEKTEIPPLLFVPHEKEISLIQDLRLSYLTDEHYSIETNSPILPGTEIELETHPFSNILTANKFEVRSLSEEGLYYYKRYNIKLHPVVEDLSVYEKRIKKWISDSQGKIKPKQTKILLADPYLVWFEGIDKAIRDIGFTVNFQTRLEGIEHILRKRRPQIICLAIDDQDSNSINAARRLVNSLKDITGYSPYLLIVNCPVPTETLKKSLQYPNMMAIRTLLKADELAKMAQSLERKLNLEVDSDDDDIEKRVYFNSSQEHVTIKYRRSIRLLGMTESMIYFQSSDTIPDFTVFHLEDPVQAYVTTVPHFKQELKELPKPYYVGLINNTGEKSNSKLRFYLNKLIQESNNPEDPEEEGEGS